MQTIRNIFRKAELLTLVVCISVGGLLYGAGVARGEQSAITGVMNTAGMTVIVLPAVTLTATPGLCDTGSIHLAWNAVSGAEGYRLFRDSTGNQIYDGADVTYSDNGLPNGSAHTYYLQAYKSGVTPSYTSTNAAAPIACPTVTAISGGDLAGETDSQVETQPANTTSVTQTAVGAPVPTAKNLAAHFDLSVGGVVLVWSADGFPTGFGIFRRTFNSDFASIGTIAGMMRYVDKHITPATSYEYLVRACGSSGCSNQSNIVGVQTPQYTVSSVAVSTSTATSTSKTTTSVAPAPVKTVTSVTAPTTATRPATSVGTQPSVMFRSVSDKTVPPAQVYVAPPRPVSNVSRPQFNAAEARAFVGTLETIAGAVTGAQATIDGARGELVRSIDAHIDAVLQAGVAQNPAEAEAAVKAVRESLVAEIDRTVNTSVTLSPAQLSGLKKLVNDGFTKIDRAAEIDLTVHDVTRENATEAVTVLGSTLQSVATSLQTGGAADLYKDTNKDGISDYDSKHIYNLDPIAPSPVTIVNGEKLTAGDKVLKGYDPTAKELIALPLEQPIASPAPETTVYKVEDVKLTSSKQVKISGIALPNSFVTIYIYSTPIVVTVKSDRNGKWEYTMDRELENGEHTIYAATVDNTGKILAKTVAIPFTRTAEAATLDTVPPLGAASVERPGISNNRVVIPLVLISVLFIIGALYVIGKDRQSAHNIPPTPQA